MNSSSPYWKSIFIGILFVTIIANFVNSAYDFIPVIFALLSLVIIISNLILVFLTKDVKHIFILPFLFLTWVYFLSPYLKSERVSHAYRIIPDNFLNEMAIYCSLAVFAMYFGYYLFLNNRSISPLTDSNYRAPLSTIRKLLVIFLALGIIFRTGSEIFPELMDSLGNTIQILFYAPTIVVALFVLYFLREGKSIPLKLLVSLYILLEFFFRVAETLYFHVILLFAGGFLVYFFEKRKIPFKFALFFLIITVPLFLTRFDHRYSVVVDRWYNGNESSFIDISMEGINLFENTLFNWDLKDYSKELDGKNENRFEQISYLGQCVYKHEIENKAFLAGETFYWLPIAPIPRLLIPFKPINNLSTDIAEEYGVKGNGKGSMNFPMLVESYINFSFFGIILFSLFLGIFIKWVVLKIGFGLGDINLLIFINLLKHFLAVEANITLVLGGMLQVLIFWWLLMQFIALNRSN